MPTHDPYACRHHEIDINDVEHIIEAVDGEFSQDLITISTLKGDRYEIKFSGSTLKVDDAGKKIHVRPAQYRKVTNFAAMMQDGYIGIGQRLINGVPTPLLIILDHVNEEDVEETARRIASPIQPNAHLALTA